MNTALVVVGVIVMLVGIVGAAFGFIAASSAETTYAFFCPSGQMPPQACAGLLASAATYSILGDVMSGVFVLGLALAIAGAILTDRPPVALIPVPPVPPPGAWRICVKCSASMPYADRFCPHCGTPQW